MDDDYRIALLQNIHTLQPAFREAENKVLGSEPFDELLYQLYRELSSYLPGEEPHKAVYLIARCRTLLDEFGKSYQTISLYREVEKKLEEYDMRKAIENG